MAGDSQSQRVDNLTAVCYMLAAVFLYSWLPVIIEKGSSSESTSIFYAMLKLFSFCSSFIFLFIFYRPFLKSKKVWMLVRKNIFQWLFIFLVIGDLDYLVFGFAVLYMDVAIVSIIYETWPLFIIFYYSWLEKKMENKKNDSTEDLNNKKKPSMFTFCLIILSLAGAVFAILSQEGAPIFEDYNNLTDLIIGVMLAILSMVLGVLAANGIIWGNKLSKIYAKECANNRKDKEEFIVYKLYSRKWKKMSFPVPILFSIIGYIVAGIFVSTFNAVVGVVFLTINEDSIVNFDTFINFDFLFFAIMGGIFVSFLASTFWKTSNLITDNLAVNAIGYVTPILSIIWLLSLDVVDVLRIDYLFIGGIIIIVTNLLINFNTSVRFGYKILILSLWCFGTFVYLWDFIPLENDSYYSIITVTTTMYILVLAFRLDRLAKIESEVEILALSKQQGNNFGELLALMILGAITIGVLVFTYPIGLCGNKGISVEIVAILLSTIVAFLFVNILDLQKDRNAPIIREKKGTEKKQWRFGIVFRDLEDRNFERWLSFIICIAIIGVYIWLLYYKWIDIPC